MEMDMAKFIQAIENSFENEKIGGFSDFAAGIAFLAFVVAGLSWLTF